MERAITNKILKDGLYRQVDYVRIRAYQHPNDYDTFKGRVNNQKVAYIPKRHIESKTDYELIEE